MAHSSSIRPRVLQVVGSLNTGGAETMIVSATQALGDLIETDFLVFGNAEGTLEARARATGARVLRMREPRSVGPVRFVAALSRLLRAESYDAVHSHVNLASGLVMIAAHRAGVPVRISHSHSGIFPESGLLRRAYKRLSRRWMRRRATVLAACSSDAGRGLFGDAWAGARATVIHNGIHLDEFLHAREHRDDVRTELGIAASQRAIGVVARLVDVKNHAFLVDLLGERQARTESWVLVLVGDGPLRSSLMGHAERLGIADRVIFLGLRPDVSRILGGLDALAIPSLIEGLPVALVEAQAAGVPAVVSKAVTRESDLGLGLVSWASLDDPDAWVRALTRDYPRPDPRAVRARFEEAGFDIHSTARSLLDIYRGGAPR